jgi:hypothetical protein
MKETLKDFISALPDCADCFAPAIYRDVEGDGSIKNPFPLDFCDECMPQNLKDDYECLYSKSLRKLLKILEEE